MEIGGIYPMLYAFFDEDGGLRRSAVTRQIGAALSANASGIAVLGLGTEVFKLGQDEQRALVNWVIGDVAGQVPVAVTISQGNTADMIAAGKSAIAAGASWLILQPPRPPISGSQLIDFFGRVAGALDCPIGIQNAPEFLGVGLTPDELAELNRQHPNVSLVKAESSALAVGTLIDALGGRMKVFNGRGGLELTDNYRAGVDGMIPGIETVDLQVRIDHAMRSGESGAAETLYRSLLPAISFLMQSLSQFLLYGKHVAALRLGIAPSAQRLPSDTPTERGLAWARRYADELGPLPG
ncbi:MAG: dihydrodipicolinate synthase family protein [Hyphomicrobiaceae bacterium]|nr:dihydrodipicolinate synthase family protein [Hyphomicrobiaceae bacterium]